MKEVIQKLKTPFEDGINDGWKIYPRPQMKRSSFLSLCGEWDLSVKKQTEESFIGHIRVPFPPESRISGIERPLGSDERYVYKKEFDISEGFNRGRIILHFGAVDQIARVYLNNNYIGEHRGGYLPFDFDITESIRIGKNRLYVEVTDNLDLSIPYGKQKKKRGGMWYTPISGIWQPVWLESVPKRFIGKLRITPSLQSVTIETVGGNDEKVIVITSPEQKHRYHYNGNTIKIDIENPHLWTPEDPFLYSFTISDGEDEIESYFALRELSVKTLGNIPYICLNGKPYYFHGLLDQGYFSDGIYIPASPEGYAWDIQTAKRLGFNTLRKHIKIEPELFYYYCDKYGMIVFQDMVNSGKYHYIADTVLPTIGFRKRFSFSASKARKEQFEQDCKRTIDTLYNHPSVCYYTIFNEGWGQFDADRIYNNLKQSDPTRIWDATSGWFTEKESDVDSEHIYFRKISFKNARKRPLVLSEFGGYSFKLPKHSFNLSKTYGYKNFDTAESFENGLKKLYREEIIPAMKKGLCATVLTQLSDVEDETNGLVTYDRRKVKIDEDCMSALAKELYEAFADK